MSELRIVNVDMDGVLANFDETVEQRLLMEDPAIDVSDKSSNFYISRRVKTQAARDLVHKVQSTEGLFASLPLIEGAQAGWRRLIELGYHPRVLSSPLRSNLTCIAEKLAWLDHYFGPSVAEEAIIAKDKTVYNGIALIDDRPVIAGAEHASWQHIVFSRPYNTSIETDFRLNSWEDPQLSQLLACCAERYATLRP